MASAQALSGNTVSIAATNVGYHDFKINDAVNLHLYSSQLEPWYFSIPMMQALPKLIKQADIVHLHGIWDYPCLAAALICRPFKVPYVISPHGMLDPWSLSQNRWKKAFYLFLFGQTMVDGAKRVHFTSEGERSRCALPIALAKTFVAPLGLSKTTCRDLPAPRAFEDQFPRLKDARIILFLARIHPIKGLDILLPAIAELLKKHEEWVLVLAGGGENGYINVVKEQIKSLGLEKSVLMTGHVHGEVKTSLLKLAKVFVLPSHSENFGVSVIEAMQAGLPVVISDQIAIAADVLKYQAGLVFALDPDDIREKVEKVITDTDLQRKLGSNGKRLVGEVYDWDKITPRQIEIYQTILNQ